MNDANEDIIKLKEIIKGKIDAGVIHLTKELVVKYKLEKLPIHVIPLKMTSQNTMMAIVYNENPDAHKNAHKLYNDIKIKNHDRSIDSTERTIKECLNEIENPKGLNKKVVEVVKDEENNDVKICTVNGAFVKGTNPGLGFIQFVEGGHYYVDSYPGYKENIPEDEIWIDEVFYKTPENFKGIVGHEFKERNNMKCHKMSYDKAHDLSNAAEKQFRGSKDKLEESFQFNKIKDLMKRVI
jgi:hypothetical protein